MSQQRRIQRIL